MNYDVIVVGAGPAGASAAKEAAKNGLNVVLVEEHQEIGEPIQCAGIVSKRTIEKSGVTDASLNKVRGAYIHSPNESCLKIDAGETKAHIINRHIFDKLLAKEAVGKGSKLWLKTRAVDWDNKNLVLKKDGAKKTLSPRVVVGADGIGSLIRRKVTDLKPKAFLSGAQVLLKGVDVRDTDFVELFLGNEFAPGFFGWFIPIDDDKGRLGLCVRRGKNPLFYLNKLLEEHPVVKKRYSGEEVEYTFGAIPIGILEKTSFGRTLLVGDSAAQVKPTSGGGVYPGIMCGKIAGEVSSDFINNSVELSDYDGRWKRRIGKELKRGWLFHRTWNDFSDKQIDSFINDVNSDKIRDLINQFGDIDYPSKLFFKLLINKPSLLKFTIPLLKNYLKQIT